ncbi:MAG: hypothetical protein IKH30_00915 [Clostridia bacterium]|nr:hypothetical protein [Clostridia bacterium]
MIATEKITFAQKHRIDSIRAAFSHPSESHSFASLFLWQQDMGLTIRLEEEEPLCLIYARDEDVDMLCRRREEDHE